MKSVIWSQKQIFWLCFEVFFFLLFAGKFEGLNTFEFWFNPVLSEYLTFAWTLTTFFCHTSMQTLCWFNNICFAWAQFYPRCCRNSLCWNHRHCVLGSESSSLLKSATCLSSDSPTIVKCLLTFDRTQGPFLYCQVFVWVKSLFTL